MYGHSNLRTFNLHFLPDYAIIYPELKENNTNQKGFIMANKTKHYLMLDCETATLPFADEIAGDNPERKKRIAIAKPLIYDIGWTITNRKGDILESKQFLIAETFSVPAIFNTAYYKEKRPIYLEMLRKNETSIKPWDEVMDVLIADMAAVDGVGAFNSIKKKKKAIPLTLKPIFSASVEKNTRFLICGGLLQLTF